MDRQRNVAVIYGRGGAREVVSLPQQTSSLTWGRKRNALSAATLGLKLVRGSHEARTLEDVHTWAHELVVFRGGRRVWEGPIRRKSTPGEKSEDELVISAWDVSGWLNRRLARKRVLGENIKGPVMDEAVMIVQRAMELDDPNVVEHMLALQHAKAQLVERDVAAYSTKADADLQSLVGKGLNYTVNGRRILMWPDELMIGRLNALDPIKHLGVSPTTVEAGDDLATRVFATDSEGRNGRATSLAGVGDVDDATGVSAYYGLHETITDGGERHAVDTLNRMARVVASQLYPAPTVVTIPTGTVLSAEAPVTLEELVPGVVIPITAATKTGTVTADLVLDELSVTQTPDGEEVTVSLVSPSSLINTSEA